jgi:hypothetical protein
VQTELTAHKDLFDLRPRAILSFDEEKVLIQYLHPTTGQAGSMVAGQVTDLLEDETRLMAAIIQRLKGMGGDKPLETLIRPDL